MRKVPHLSGTLRRFGQTLPLCAALVGSLVAASEPAFAQQPQKAPADAKAQGTPAEAGQPAADAQPDAKADAKTGAAQTQPPGVSPEAETPKAEPPKPVASEPAAPKPNAPPPGLSEPVSVDPDKDAKALEKQGSERPKSSVEIAASRSDVYAENWWSHVRPSFDFHGYFRLRAELFHKFSLGRKDGPGTVIWPQPPDNDHIDINGNPHNVAFCGDDPLPARFQTCQEYTQAGANMRFRLNPELHISDNVRVLSQVDILDNLVLGSTPEGYMNRPSANGYSVIGRGGYAPTGAFATTQWAPTVGVNSLQDSITVKRVWGEYVTPVGVLRFGRMPSHWGLGMFANAGDGYDSDWQSTADRIMFVTGFKDLDLYFAGAWDFANEGPISTSLSERQGQPYDLGQLDDVSQYVFVAVRRRDPELQKRDLARGDVVLNGGLYFVFRNQFLANDTGATGTSASLGESAYNVSQGYVRRGATAYIPDLWFQFLYKKFRFELEAAMILGSLENTIREGGAGSDYENVNSIEDPGWKIRQFGLATEMDYRAVEDRLRFGFGFGYSSGDPDVDSLAPRGEGLQPQLTSDRTFSTFRFHPDYRVDLILFRNILTRVQGAYYFKPTVDYDFTRNKNGQKLGGSASVIWSRASEFVQTPGHKRDLGIELNGSIYYQSKDGSLNDDPNKMGGFYTAIQYGVLFPLGGFDYMPGEKTAFQQKTGTAGIETETAQVLRWYMGIMF